MNRNQMIARLANEKSKWDVVIIGGGATGMGCAIDSASRGYKTLLLEQSDFAKGTSSRSTKLVHGGVRYLQQGNISLVLEALKERGILRRNAPHLVHNLQFIVPSYDWWQGPFYGIGLKLYDMLAGKEGFGTSQLLSTEETLKHIPTIERKGLNGGVIYHDGQFDDSRLIINMMQTVYEQGALPLNYMKVVSLQKDNGLISGLEAVDLESGQKVNIVASVVINATGVYTDDVRKMDDPDAKEILTSSQGTHIVLDRSFLPGDSAIMVPHTDDGRVLFAIPWHNRVLVGTTETPVKKFDLEPVPRDVEINFLLKHAARYLEKDPDESDILSVFAGLRPLVKSGDEENTAALSRDHTINISGSGLVTITGGKWTTYRRMAEDTIDQAAEIAQLQQRDCVTKELRIHGYHNHIEEFGSLDFYGSDAVEINDLISGKEEFSVKLHDSFDTLAGEVVWAVRNEMARTVEDFLSRRTRNLLFNASASMEAAPAVAVMMAAELGRDKKWIDEQVDAYKTLAKNYVVNY